MKAYKLLLPLLLTSFITGCGQPGPLYLPDKAAPIHVEPQTETPKDK